VEVALIGAALALILSFQPVASELVVVLPEAGGRVGTVIVERGDERVVLDQPYAASRIAGEGAPRADRLAERDVRAALSGALSALPARPMSFLLYFITGTDTLTDESKGELERMLEELRKRQAPDIVVIGHTDRVGGLEDNDQLSLQRAERVKADLVSQGIAAGRIRAAGRGEREPLVPTADGEDEPRNRRVEINVR
jgi:outer membrane protein OmpA-like peptidoglycan-associated protein